MQKTHFRVYVTVLGLHITSLIQLNGTEMFEGVYINPLSTEVNATTTPQDI